MSPANKLSKEMIIQTAFDYADEYGLEKLSMRKLSKELNVKAMSLYNHIESKDQLIVELVDKLVGLIQFEEMDTWQETMKERAKAMKTILLEHAWATKPLVSGWNILHNFLSFFNRSIGTLVSSGFSYGDADQIISTLNSFVYGYVLKSLNFPIDEDEYQSSAEEYKNLFSKEEYPYLVALSEEIRLGEYSGKTNFELGLDMVIKGIEQTMKKENNYEY